MFGFSDIPKFLLAFFLVLPLISVLHEAGHVFFAWLMGGKNIKVTIGTGKPLLRVGMLDVRQYYFWYGLCTFDNLNKKKRFSNILIFSGGALFNLLSVLLTIFLVENGMLEPGMITYQFTYFSMYYIFFALLPMPYPDGNYSDGKIILDLLRRKRGVIDERSYRVQWEPENGEWQLLDPEKKIIHACTKEEEAVEKAHEMARNDRPSRIINVRNGEEKEIQNYPKIPL